MSKSMEATIRETKTQRLAILFNITCFGIAAVGSDLGALQVVRDPEFN